MQKFFNTAGPCNPKDHYMVDPLSRCQDLLGLIDQKSYFVIHAPRQSGKTTLLEALAQKLTALGDYAAMRVSCEVGQPFRDDFANAELVLLDEIAIAANLKLSPDLQPPSPWPKGVAGNQLKKGLGQWADRCSKPLVLFFDEIDALTNLSLESVLRQLRSGFSDRPQAFPHSIVLCGLRDVRDYKIASGGLPTLGTASPFNIKTESITFRSFDFEDVQNLYLQHTAETGQKFSEGAIARAFELTAGQPWLVNALAREVVEKIKVPPTEEITIAHFDDAA
jgi:AAA-like domain